MLFDRPNWPSHRPWVIVLVLGTVGSIAWFLSASQDRADWPGGSTVPGFVFGVIGGLIILFEFFFWIRKKVRVWPIGSAQTWLRAHIWLGLLCLPLLVLHSGLRLGGTLSTVLMTLLVIVIASGIWGLVLQTLLRKRLLEDASGETIYAAMDFMATQLLIEADRLVSATCGKVDNAGPDETSPLHADAFLAVPTMRATVLAKGAPPAPIAEAEALAIFHRDNVMPFLRQGSASQSPLADAGRAMVLFQNLKAQLPLAAHDVVDALENFCTQRRQWDHQVRLHFWLHSWLWVHFPLSVALVALMTVHVFVALKYW